MYSKQQSKSEAATNSNSNQQWERQLNVNCRDRGVSQPASQPAFPPVYLPAVQQMKSSHSKPKQQTLVGLHGTRLSSIHPSFFSQFILTSRFTRFHDSDALPSTSHIFLNLIHPHILPIHPTLPCQPVDSDIISFPFLPCNKIR